MRLLLDTCTFLWVTNGSAALSPAAREAISDPDNAVFLSAVSAWEIAVKYGLRRLPLPEAPEAFVPRWREAHGVEALALDEASALQLTRLPALHRDPFDRMIVCQAVAHGMFIVTPDHAITQYPVRALW